VTKVTRTRAKQRVAAEEYLQRNYKRVLVPDPNGHGFTARLLEFPGCFADGQTAEEAYANLESAAAEWIEAASSQGQPIPDPAGGDTYSGRIVLRLPRALHQQAAELAALNQTSLNQFLVSAIAARVGAEDLVGRMIHRLFEGPLPILPPFALVYSQINQIVQVLRGADIVQGVQTFLADTSVFDTAQLASKLPALTGEAHG
jgi:predicted RNase H-like HicB family nuclease